MSQASLAQDQSRIAAKPEMTPSTNTAAIGNRPLSARGVLAALPDEDPEADPAAPAPVTVGEEVTVPVPSEPASPRSALHFELALADCR